jgi:hypothetical protein
VELEGIYRKASSILAAFKEDQKNDRKELAAQIVTLYNRSANELALRHKLEQKIKARKAKRDQLIEEAEAAAQ